MLKTSIPVALFFLTDFSANLLVVFFDEVSCQIAFKLLVFLGSDRLATSCAVSSAFTNVLTSIKIVNYLQNFFFSTLCLSIPGTHYPLELDLHIYIYC